MKCSLRGDLMRVMGEACDRWRACENGQSDGTRPCRGPHAFVSIYELATETQFWCFENNIFA